MLHNPHFGVMTSIELYECLFKYLLFVMAGFPLVLNIKGPWESQSAKMGVLSKTAGSQNLKVFYGRNM